MSAQRFALWLIGQAWPIFTVFILPAAAISKFGAKVRIIFELCK